MTRAIIMNHNLWWRTWTILLIFPARFAVFLEVASAPFRNALIWLVAVKTPRATIRASSFFISVRIPVAGVRRTHTILINIVNTINKKHTINLGGLFCYTFKVNFSTIFQIRFTTKIELHQTSFENVLKNSRKSGLRWTKAYFFI